VIEVHDPGRESLSAVTARAPAQISEEFEGRSLSTPDSLDLAGAMRPVIGSVVLVSLLDGPHNRQLEHLFAPCQ